MYGLDLFSGYGGLTLALSKWVRPIAYCEIEKYCRAILLSRMAEKRLPYAPIWGDVRTLKGSDLPISPGIIYGGFPCQDLSVAGNGRGLEGERSGLFYEILRLSKEIKPKFIFLENVPGLRKKALHTIVWELANIGYDCRWCSVSAEEVGAPHQRKRWFLLAHSNSKGLESCQPSRQEQKEPMSFSSSEISNSNSEGRSRKTNASEEKEPIWRPETATFIRDRWPAESRICDRHDVAPFRVDQVKSLGNGVVPAQAKKAYRYLMGLEIEKLGYLL